MADAGDHEYDPSTYERSAHVYDVMNAARGKSYSDEADTVLRLVRERIGPVHTLLDVACGTGLHLTHFRRDLDVEGLEPHARMRSIAQARLGDVTVHDGDMRIFDLDRRFDVVTCLFSAIGYMLTLSDLHRAVERMAAHVAPGGVLVVEPWFHPEAWIDGLVMADSATADGTAIARLSHSRRDGHIAHFDFHWTIGRGTTLSDHHPGVGVGPHDGSTGAVEQWIEPHRLGLWTDAQYRAAFARAGLGVERDADGLTGGGLERRGLYIARRAPA